MAKKTALKRKGMPARKLSALDLPGEAEDKTKSAGSAARPKPKARRGKISRLPVADKNPATASSLPEKPQANKTDAAAKAGNPPARLRQQRLDSAITSLHNGLPDRSILMGLQEDFLIAPGQAQRDLAAAYREIEKDSARRTLGNLVDRAVLQRDEVVRRAMEKSDLRVALAAMDGRDKLLGVMNPERAESENSVQNLLELAELAFRSSRGGELDIDS